MVRQFEEQKGGLCTSVQSAYDKGKFQKPDFQSLKSFLIDSVQQFKKCTYIVLDAFDECHEDGRKALVEYIRSCLPGNSLLRFFITSRPNTDVDFLASSFVDQVRLIDVIAGKGAQTRDLEHFIEQHLSRVHLRDKEKSFILQGIIEKAEGLLSLHI